MTSTEYDPSSAEVDGPAISCLVSTALSRAEKTTAIIKVRYLERELFDDGGHIRKGEVAAQTDEIVGLINDSRRAPGSIEPLWGPKLQPSPRIINSDSSSVRRPGRVDNAEPGTALVDRP
jgi:hypothetical protein